MLFVKCITKRTLAIIITAAILLTIVLAQNTVSASNNIPTEMLDNIYLDALEYTGYNVSKQINDGNLYSKFGSSGTPDNVKSNIPYSLSAAVDGTETNSSGKPNINSFEKYGLCCGSYITYVYYNYLPNIAKIDTSHLEMPEYRCSVSGWENAVKSWINDGAGENIKFTQSSDGKLNTSKEIPIGSIVIFKSNEYSYAHVAIYAGYYNGKHFITHCGGDEGPCVQAIENLKLYVDQSVKMIVAPKLNAKVKLNKTSLTLGKGESYKLTANGKVTWSSSNKSIVSVSSSGKITAKKSGTAVVSAKNSYGKKAVCKITVKNAPSSISLNKTNLTLGIGETYNIDAILNTGTASYTTKYTSNNKSVASVVSTTGLVTAKNTGTAVITATTYNGIKANCKITIKEAPKALSLNKTNLTLGIGETYDLDSYLPKGTAAYHIKYTSNNTTAASVAASGGLVTAKSVGKATITATAYNGVSVKCTVTVKKAPTNITLNRKSLNLKVGEKFDLDSKLPSGCASYHVYYSSNNSNIASVEKCGGIITAIKAGKAKITAETYNGKTVTCLVNVT